MTYRLLDNEFDGLCGAPDIAPAATVEITVQDLVEQKLSDPDWLHVSAYEFLSKDIWALVAGREKDWHTFAYRAQFEMRRLAEREAEQEIAQ